MRDLTISEPVNRLPRLLCEGLCAVPERHVPHSYQERRRRPDCLDTTFDYIFTCDTCGAERVFGATS